MDRIAAADVDAAVDEMVGLLAPHADGDWSTPAGTLEWSCWATAAHVAHDLAAYAAQLAARATDGYLPFDLVAEAGATPRDVLSVVAASGRLLSAAGSALPAGRRPPAPRCGRRRTRLQSCSGPPAAPTFPVGRGWVRGCGASLLREHDRLPHGVRPIGFAESPTMMADPDDGDVWRWELALY